MDQCEQRCFTSERSYTEALRLNSDHTGSVLAKSSAHGTEEVGSSILSPPTSSDLLISSEAPLYLFKPNLAIGS